MKASKAVVLLVVFLLVVTSLPATRTAHGLQTPGAPVYFSIQPVVVDPLTDVNSSVNGLETPATPSPVGQYFNVEIHVVGATEVNVPVGLSGVEVHLDFSAILANAKVINFTGMLGTPEGVLTGPPSGIIYAINPNLYNNADSPVGPPYTSATRYEVAAASTADMGWNSPDGLVAVILFQITGQPAQQDFVAPMTIIFSDITDQDVNEVPFDIADGTLHIDASAAPPQSYTLTVNVVGNGSVTQSPLNATYVNGTVVTLTAVSAVNWTFQGWSGDLSGAQNPATITMNSNKTVTATFVQAVAVNYTLTVNVVGSGSVTKTPEAATYPSGTIVTLTAAGAVNWTFQGWSGDLSGVQNPATITMNSNKTVTATFTQGVQYYNLTVNVVGSGSVTKSPQAATYLSGTVVTLTAVSAVNWTFQGWSGDLSGAQNPATITMNSNKTVTATFSSAAFPGKIDIFTQKAPFDGKGSNQPSDAFQQQELIILYALVSFGGVPIANKVVAFQAYGPPNPLQNITVGGSTLTNSSGIALFSFRIPTAPISEEQIIFGEWHAIATVDIDEVTVMDTLTFQVGWIISIKSIATLNSQLVAQTNFLIMDTIVFNLTLENIAFTPKNAVITIDAQDTKGNPIIHIELDDLSIPPGESNIQGSSQISENAKIGLADASATAYTASPTSGGIPWSPSVFTTFNIVSSAYYTLTVNTVGSGSVTQSPSAATYVSGTIVTLTALPSPNWLFQGWSGDLSGTQSQATITMNSNKNVTATFIRSSLVNYTLTVNLVGDGSVTKSPQAATYLSGTVVTLTAVSAVNWTFQGWSGDLSGSQNPATITMDGDKVVTAVFGLTGHDVAITSVSVSPSIVSLGETVQILVEVANLGNYSETFDVTVYYDANIIQVIPLTLAPHSSQTITLEWNTANVDQGVYTIAAKATIVEGDVNPENNSFTDGSVTVTAVAPEKFLAYWALLIPFMGLAILGAIFLIFFMAYYSRRRRKRSRATPRYAVIVHAHV